MTRYKVTPGAYIVHQGDPLHDIYFVCNGSLEVLKSDVVVCILGKWDVIGPEVTGDRSITVTSQYNVKAVTYCEVECVSIRGLLDAETMYPELSGTLVEDILAEFSCKLWSTGMNEAGGSSQNQPAEETKLIPPDVLVKHDDIVIDIEDPPREGNKEQKQTTSRPGSLASTVLPRDNPFPLPVKKNQELGRYLSQTGTKTSDGLMLNRSASEGSVLKKVTFYDEVMTSQSNYNNSQRRRSDIPSISLQLMRSSNKAMTSSSSNKTMTSSTASKILSDDDVTDEPLYPKTKPKNKIRVRQNRHLMSPQRRRRTRRKIPNRRRKTEEKSKDVTVWWDDSSDSDTDTLRHDFRSVSRGYSRYPVRGDSYDYHEDDLSLLRGYANKVSALSRDLNGCIARLERSQHRLLCNNDDNSVFETSCDDSSFKQSTTMTSLKGNMTSPTKYLTKKFSNSLYPPPLTSLYTSQSRPASPERATKTYDVTETLVTQSKVTSLPTYVLTTPGGEVVDIDVMPPRKQRWKRRKEDYFAPDSESGYLSGPNRRLSNS